MFLDQALKCVFLLLVEQAGGDQNKMGLGPPQPFKRDAPRLIF